MAETLLRRAVWFAVDHPRLVSLALMAGGLGLLRLVRGALARCAASTATPLHLPLSHAPRVESAAGLRAAVDAAFAQAVAAQTLQPLTSSEELVVRDGGVAFVVTVLDGAAYERKQLVSPANLVSAAAGSSVDASSATAASLASDPAQRPRWPPADAFADLSLRSAGDGAHNVACEIFFEGASGAADVPRRLVRSHVILLNKFPCRDRHLVIVSRRFQSQTRPMGEADVQCLWRCVRGLNGVGFFNGGFRSGASQPRRHMQLIPLDALHAIAPLYSVSPAAGAGGLPIDAAVEARIAELSNVDVTAGRAAFTLPAFAFKHLFCVVSSVGDGPAAARDVFRTYRRLLTSLLPDVARLAAERDEAAAEAASLADLGALAGLVSDAEAADEAAERASLPSSPTADDGASHNVVLSPRWMLVVPRVIDSANIGGTSVAVNALGFCGLLLARGHVRDVVQEHGPLAVLRGVCVA